MIGKEYFKRQATTLRKMVRVTRNPSIADRLSLMAEHFDARSSNEIDEVGREVHPTTRTANREDERG
jgi:hypothetical protein